MAEVQRHNDMGNDTKNSNDNPSVAVQHVMQPPESGARIAKPRGLSERVGHAFSRAFLKPSSMPEQGETSFDVLGMLQRRWPVLAGVALVVTAVVGGIVLSLPPVYESQASFLVDAESESSTSGEALALLDRLGRARKTETEVELLLGRRVVTPVVEALHLQIQVDAPWGIDAPSEVLNGFSLDSGRAIEGRYRIVRRDELYVGTDLTTGRVLSKASAGTRMRLGGMSFDVPSLLEYPQIDLEVLPFAKAVDITTARLEAGLARRQAEVVKLTCKGGSASSAQMLCAEVQASYLRVRQSLQSTEASAAAGFLRSQVERVRSELSEAEEQLRGYQETSDAVALGEQATEAVKQRASLIAQRQLLEAEHEALGERLNELTGDASNSHDYRRLASFPTFLQGVNSPISVLMESLVELEDQRSKLASRRGGKNVELSAMTERIHELEREILRSAQSYHRSLTAQLQSIDRVLSTQKRHIARVPKRVVESTRLQRQVDRLEELFRFLQTRRQEAEVAEVLTLPGVHVVDEPFLPYKPSFPNRKLTLALASLLGLGAGLLVVLWLELSGHKLLDERELRSWGLPILAFVPPLRPRWSIRAATRGFSGTKPVEDRATDALRALSLDLQSAGLDRIRTIAVTSPGSGEGKTFCSLGLARETAQEGRNTLLIDGDLRQRGLSQLMKVPPNQPGLGELMESEEEIELALKSLALPTPEGFFLIPCGKVASASRQFLRTVRSILDAVAFNVDLAVVDTPPINLSVEAAQIAAITDGVILIVRSRITTRDALELTLDRLDRVGARVLGVIMNDAEVPRGLA